MRSNANRPRSECNACAAVRRREYRAKLIADPKRAAEFKRKQHEHMERWLSKPENREKQKKYSHDYYQRHADRLRESNTLKTREWRARNPDQARINQRKYYAKMMADPVKHQAFLESRRIAYRLRNEQQGKPMAARQYALGFKQTKVMVDGEPLRSYLCPLVKGGKISVSAMARDVGLSERRIRAVLNGEYKTIDIATADRILHALKGPPLRSLYPDA